MTSRVITRAGAYGLVVLAASLILVMRLESQEREANPHGEMRIQVDCAACHTSAAWRPIRSPMDFDHSRQTAFPLRQAHTAPPCASCHLRLRFTEPKISADDCASCHVDVHQGNLSPDCRSCHEETSFSDLNGVGLHTRTAFPLTGSHLQLTCQSCHQDDTGGAFTTLNSDCVACHDDDYRRTGAVDHVAAGFPTDCKHCHSTITWTGGVPFDHPSAANGYPLIGAHAVLRCASCHLPPDGALRFVPAGPGDCLSCHQADYTREHGGSSFPTTCLDCHNQNSWGGAEFDHAASGFALLGAHGRISCESCHLPPSGTVPVAPSSQDDCVACHRADYDREHSGSGFPITCLSCHNNDNFGGADFRDHDAQFFPIYSGPHAGKWVNDCATCHTVPSDYRSYTCLTCHEHRQSEMDPKHSEVQGYVYQSSECLRCHPAGRKN